MNVIWEFIELREREKSKVNTLGERIRRSIGVGEKKEIMGGGSWEMWERQAYMAISSAVKIEAMLRIRCDVIVSAI